MEKMAFKHEHQGYKAIKKLHNWGNRVSGRGWMKCKSPWEKPPDVYLFKEQQRGGAAGATWTKRKRGGGQRVQQQEHVLVSNFKVLHLPAWEGEGLRMWAQEWLYLNHCWTEKILKGGKGRAQGA